MFGQLIGRVNAPVIVVDQSIRMRQMRADPDQVLTQGGFATIYRSFNLYPGMVGFSVCPFEFDMNTKNLIAQHNEFPAIMIDDRILPYLSHDAVQAAVAHEITHIRNGDYFKNLPLDPLHPARVNIELGADRGSAEIMGTPIPMINMISKLRYALPALFAERGIQIENMSVFDAGINLRLAALSG